MSPTITHGGQTFVVTQAWHEQHSAPYPDLATLDKATIDARRRDLLARSNMRDLAPAELALLSSLDAQFNVRNALDWLDGTDHTSFGFEGADQVHGNSHHWGCGCVTHHVFDHHKRGQDGMEIYHHTPRRTCADHAHLKAAPAALHAELLIVHEG